MADIMLHQEISGVAEKFSAATRHELGIRCDPKSRDGLYLVSLSSAMESAGFSSSSVLKKYHHV